MDTRKLGAEFLGTFWLVFGGCGSVLFSVVHGGPVSIDILGIALAFGLTVVTGAYAFGHISGGHFNPAVTLGLVVGRRFESKDLAGYWAAQVLGGLAAGAVLWLIASGVEGFAANGFASNGYGDLSPGKYSLLSALVAEVVLTAFFLIIILGATDKRAAPGFGGLAIGLALCLIHIIGIPIDGVSVNPARSTATAVFAISSGHLAQLWLFWVAPLAGGALGGVIYPMIAGEAPKMASSP